MVEPRLSEPLHVEAPPQRPRRLRLPRPRLSVVVVDYRAWSDTARLASMLLRSKQGQRGALEVVVVDNHSPGKKLAARMRRWRGLALRRWGQNRGFARAVNEGCRLSRGDWFLLLNPDVTLPDHFVDQAMQLAERLALQEPRAGIVGFQLRNSDGSRQHSWGDFPTLPGLLSRLLLPRARRKYSTRRIQGRSEVPWVTGCCVLVRRECLEALGGFDERFFLYYEDVDFCRRAQEHGWSVWFEPAPWASHHRPLQGREPCPAVRAFTRHALLSYSARHWPHWQRWLLAGIVGVEALGRQMWARWNRDLPSAWIFRELGAMAQNMARGREQAARRHLDRVVQQFSRHAAP